MSVVAWVWVIRSAFFAHSNANYILFCEYISLNLIYNKNMVEKY